MRFRANAFAAAVFMAAAVFPAAADPGAAYLGYKPLVTATVSGLGSALGDLENGLMAFGESDGWRSAGAIALRWLGLPSLDWIDDRRPASFFLLTADPPSGLPVRASLVPVANGAGPKLLDSFGRAYRVSSGGALRCYSSPVRTNLPPVSYVAIIDGRAMISPDVDGVRWLAMKCRDKAVPAAVRFRDAPLHVTIDPPLAGRFCEALSALPPPDAVARRRDDGGRGVRVLRELPAFFSAFTSLGLAVRPGAGSWDVSVRFGYPPGCAFARGMAAAPAGGGRFPAAPKCGASCSASFLPAFVRLLPRGSRAFLADLADRSHLIGFHLLPAAPDADEKLFPALSGSGAFAFVSDPVGKYVGSVSAYGLASPALAEAALREYFGGGPGGVARNKAVRGHATRQSRGKRIFTYDMLPRGAGNLAPMEQTAMVFASLIEMNHVETAITGGRLVVARGRHGLIDSWIENVENRDAKAATRTRAETAAAREDGVTDLGGGVLDPVGVAHGALAFIPDFPEVARLMPLPSPGTAWRMSRTGRDTTFDASVPGSEIIACMAMTALNKEYEDEFMSRFLMWLQQGGDDEETAGRGQGGGPARTPRSP